MLADIADDSWMRTIVARNSDELGDFLKETTERLKKIPGLTKIKLPVVGLLLTGGFATVRLSSAAAEDAYFQESMNQLGATSPTFAGHSTMGELVSIGGEKSGAAGGAILGGAIGALGGPLAWATIPAGAIAGGFLGDWVGGASANAVFDIWSSSTQDRVLQLMFGEPAVATGFWIDSGSTRSFHPTGAGGSIPE